MPKKFLEKQKHTITFLLPSIIVLLICAYTDIDYMIIDFISIDLVDKNDVVFDFNYFFLPIYIFVVREILIQVKIGEFLLKYFNAEEPVLEENIIKNLLYKKKTPPKQNNEESNNQSSNKEDEKNTTDINSSK